MRGGRKVFPKDNQKQASFPQQRHIIVISSYFQNVCRIIAHWILQWIQIIKFSGCLWDFGESQLGVLIIDNMGWDRKKKRDFYLWH